MPYEYHYAWRCENLLSGDVKFAAKEEHKNELEEAGYVCSVYLDERWTAANIPPE